MFFTVWALWVCNAHPPTWLWVMAIVPYALTLLRFLWKNS
jgi:hypothetical protein